MSAALDLAERLHRADCWRRRFFGHCEDGPTSEHLNEANRILADVRCEVR